MEKEKEFKHQHGEIRISDELSTDEKEYIKSMYNWREQTQLPMLTEKIIILSRRIEKFDKNTEKSNRILTALTVLLTVIGVIQIFFIFRDNNISYYWLPIFIAAIFFVFTFLLGFKIGDRVGDNLIGRLFGNKRKSS